MFILGDARLPLAVRKNLSHYGQFIPFYTRKLVYDAISGHPDIFFCSGDRQLVVAPNLPEEYLQLLKNNGISFQTGNLPAENRYPHTARYNAVITSDFIIHHPQITDKRILETFTDKKLIAVKQGYVRCNLLHLKEDLFITSDKGIEKALKKEGLQPEYFSPEGIVLPGFSHGFLGGCLGLYENKILITGSLSHYPEGDKLKQFIQKKGFQPVELYDGPLLDGGGLLLL